MSKDFLSEKAGAEPSLSEPGLPGKIEEQARLEEMLRHFETLYPKLIDLDLSRVEQILQRLGFPHQQMPPAVHVAGTNGKGSFCAFLRALSESFGLRTHVYTSPHLVSFCERIRLAGELVAPAELFAVFNEIREKNDGRPITGFEITTAAAFLLFSRVPADLAVIETGLGGRLDATNVIKPVITAITSVSLDHQAFLGETLAEIAGEKAGIIKEKIPVVTGTQRAEVLAVLEQVAAEKEAPFLNRGEAWEIEVRGEKLFYQNRRRTLILPLPSLPGSHQIDNLGIALTVFEALFPQAPDEVYFKAVQNTVWPARLQRLSGKLRAFLPEEAELWLDGAHNQGGGEALALQCQKWQDKPLDLVIGMKQGKDLHVFVQFLLPYARSVWAVKEPEQYLGVLPEEICKINPGRILPGPDVRQALEKISHFSEQGRVLICGSLYLAGEVLKADETLPV